MRLRIAAFGVVIGLLLTATGCGDDSGAEAGDRDRSGSVGASGSSGPSTSADGEDLGEAVGSAGEDAGSGSQPDWEPVQLAVNVVAVPATAAPGNDACGAATSYDAGLLVDRQPETAWRTDGDATGQTLTFSLDGSRRVRQVGLVPGYAKVDPCDGVDRFAQNRRVTAVTWMFDDGSSVRQDLADLGELQTIAVDATTTNIVVRLEGVTADPQRDFTAISEISVRGN